MDQVWQMEDAINHFNDIINSAMHHKIQIIELKNHQKVMVILMEDFENAVKPKNSLVDFFRQSPIVSPKNWTEKK